LDAIPILEATVKKNKKKSHQRCKWMVLRTESIFQIQ